MTDNEIKKALECCGTYKSKCGDCPYNLRLLQHCDSDMCKDTLDLINRLEAEAKEKDEMLKAQADKIFLYEKVIKEKSADVERYQHIKETVDGFWSEIQKLSMFKGKDKPTLEELLEYIEQVKSEAIKEFWSKLVSKYESVNGQYVDRAMNRIAKDTIKEMTEQSVNYGSSKTDKE